LTELLNELPEVWQIFFEPQGLFLMFRIRSTKHLFNVKELTRCLNPVSVLHPTDCGSVEARGVSLFEPRCSQLPRPKGRGSFLDN
jgi:hypothetical protein